MSVLSQMGLIQHSVLSNPGTTYKNPAPPFPVRGPQAQRSIPRAANPSIQRPSVPASSVPPSRSYSVQDSVVVVPSEPCAAARQMVSEYRWGSAPGPRSTEPVAASSPPSAVRPARREDASEWWAGAGSRMLSIFIQTSTCSDAWRCLGGG